jgi:peptide-methionine (R)-S-oxide reductase
MFRQNLKAKVTWPNFLFIILIMSFWGILTAQKIEPINKDYPVKKTAEEWQNELGPQAYSVLREHGTERAFSGEYWDNKEKGKYICRGCDQELFSSETKFDSGTGWPSYYEVIGDSLVDETSDSRYGMNRVEVSCSRCGGHLGHLFNDGPAPTGKRYCINSISMKFVKEK